MSSFECHQSWYDNLDPHDFDQISKDNESDKEDAQQALSYLIEEIFSEHTECDEETIKESILYLAKALDMKIDNIQDKKINVAPLKILKKTQERYENKLNSDKEFVKRNINTLSSQLYGHNKFSYFDVEASIKNILWHCEETRRFPCTAMKIQTIGL